MSFTFDASNTHTRVIADTVYINGSPMHLDQTYLLATKSYIYMGRDGFTSIAEGELVNDDVADLRSLVIQNLRILQVLTQFSAGLHHRDSNIVSHAIKRFKKLSKFNHGKEQIAESPLSPVKTPAGGVHCYLNEVTHKYSIHPLVEGRIVCINKPHS